MEAFLFFSFVSVTSGSLIPVSRFKKAALAAAAANGADAAYEVCSVSVLDQLGPGLFSLLTVILFYFNKKTKKPNLRFFHRRRLRL